MRLFDLPLSPCSAYNNDFEGTIPSEIASLKDLQNFVVAENMLTGNIVSRWIFFTSIYLLFNF